jgi:hypothetical protein
MLLHFCRFHVNCQFCRCHCHFLGEICGDESFIYFCCFAINFKNIDLFNPVCERCVLTYLHHFDVFFMWSGNHKFYIQFLRLLGLQSFIITL